MSVRTAFAVLSMVIAIVPSAEAQVSKPAFSMALGLASPTGTFHSGFQGEGFKRALTPVFAVRSSVRGLPFDIRLDAILSRHGANDSLKASLGRALGTGYNEHVTLLGVNFDAFAFVRRHWRARPYVLAGPGLYMTWMAVGAGIAPATRLSRIGLGWNAGGGVSYRVRRVDLLLEARLVSAPAPGGSPRITFLHITTGLQFGTR